MPTNWPMLLTVPTMLSFHLFSSHIIPNCVHKTGIVRGTAGIASLTKNYTIKTAHSRRSLSFFPFRQTPICCTSLSNWHRTLRNYKCHWPSRPNRWFAGSGTWDICTAECSFLWKVPLGLTRPDRKPGFRCRIAGFRI